MPTEENIEEQKILDSIDLQKIEEAKKTGIYKIDQKLENPYSEYTTENLS